MEVLKLLQYETTEIKKEDIKYALHLQKEIAYQQHQLVKLLKNIHIQSLKTKTQYVQTAVQHRR